MQFRAFFLLVRLLVNFFSAKLSEIEYFPTEIEFQKKCAKKREIFPHLKEIGNISKNNNFIFVCFQKSAQTMKNKQIIFSRDFEQHDLSILFHSQIRFDRSFFTVWSIILYQLIDLLLVLFTVLFLLCLLVHWITPTFRIFFKLVFLYLCDGFSLHNSSFIFILNMELVLINVSYKYDFYHVPVSSLL